MSSDVPLICCYAVRPRHCGVGVDVSCVHWEGYRPELTMRIEIWILVHMLLSMILHINCMLYDYF